MQKLRTFLETAKKMPQRSHVLTLAVVVPAKGINVNEIEELVKDSGLKIINFQSRSELEKTINLANSNLEDSKTPLLCLINSDQFAENSLSGIIDLVFKF